MAKRGIPSRAEHVCDGAEGPCSQLLRASDCSPRGRHASEISKKKPSARHCHRRRVMAYGPFVSVFRGLEPRHPLGAVEFRGVGLGEEALEGGDEVAGALEHGDVAGVFEDLEAAAGELSVASRACSTGMI